MRFIKRLMEIKERSAVCYSRYRKKELMKLSSNYNENIQNNKKR